MTGRTVQWDKRGDGDPNKGRPIDTIVIGSGMGGMTAAACLAKAGERVLVLEQHHEPGGFTHVFERPGYCWDVGVHAVGEVTRRSLLGRVLHDLTDGSLEWTSLGPVYDEFWWPDGLRVDFPDSPSQLRDNLVEAFPGEVRAIDAYLAEVRRVGRAVGPWFLSRALPAGLGTLVEGFAGLQAREAFSQTTRAVLDRLTTNERLKSVLAGQWGYYGSVPSRSSFAIQALVARHFQWGGYYPVGGAQRIAQSLLRTVAEAGGWTRVATDVEAILIEGGRAVGVRLRKTGETLRARRIVSAAGVQSTIRRLLPEPFRGEGWARDVEGLDAGPAHLCLNLGFRGDIRAAGASAANKWFYETWSLEADAWRVKSGGDGGDTEAPVLYCSFPSLKNPKHDPGPEQRHTGMVVTFVPWAEFEPWVGTRWKRRGADYDAFKAALTERMLAQFFKHMPGLRPMLDVAELSTPLSTDHFVRPVRGSIYGLEPTPRRFMTSSLRPASPVRGLYFAGSEVGTVGVMGAMLGGVLAALSARPVSVGRRLLSLRS